MVRFFGGFLLIILFSCSSENETNYVQNDFELYKPSEMSALMNHMYELNFQLRSHIINGDSLGVFSSSFERILNANMTENKVKDDFFISHANSFLESQRSIYMNQGNSKDLFNQSVNSCIECHQVKCTGPISKIEKLYIP